jgi:ketosteroid isomerase-like protein
MSQDPIAATALADAARRFTQAFNENDLDGVMEWFAEDSLYDQFDGAQACGIVEIRGAFEPQFAGAFGVMKFIEEDLFVDAGERKVMISWTCSIETKDGPVSWRGLDLLRFDDRPRITRKATYAKASTLKLDAVEPGE